MNLKFVINNELLLASLLFNDRKESKGLFVELKNKLWEKFNIPYRHFLKGNDYRFFFVDPEEKLDNLRIETLEMIKDGISSKEFNEILSDTCVYKDWLESEYSKNSQEVTKHLENIVNIELPTEVFTVFVVDPRVGGGNFLGNNQIFWGHTEDWKNYNIVYLAHEYLHGIIPSGEVEHCAIELATDNELRIRLNNQGEYFYINGKGVGHSYLLEKEKELLPYWEKHLSNKDSNIFDFIEDAKQRDKSSQHHS